ncbi:hypothetical protein [Streptomyces sp. NPDC050528]|uniref:hypothetical protein n=1 Tax=Streptomyces sp. NPDC050528 TaxID=3365623 RepID=UPI0037AC8A2F
MATFAGCAQEAGEIVAARLTEVGFRARLECGGVSWEMEFPVFVRRLEGVIAIALFSAYRSSEQLTSTEARAAALRCLRELGPVELFGVLPVELGESSAVVAHLRLLSIGLTSRSAILWERLAQTARNVLDPGARAQGPESPASSDSPQSLR